MKTVQPRKQRKMLYQAPLHKRYRHFSSPLSDSLKSTYHINSVPVRMGDSVRILRGDQKGSEGKITEVDRKKYRILVEGITRQKVDGTTIQVPVHPSKVLITSLNLDDKWRREALKIETKKEVEKTAEAEKKPVKEKKQRKKRKPGKASAAEKPKKSRKRQSAIIEETEEKGES